MRRLALVVALLWFAPLLAATDRVLPFANANGISTSLVVVNPTANVVPFGATTVGPFSVERLTAWPRAGVAVERIAADDQLEVYAEIVMPSGALLRVKPLEPITGGVAEFFDLAPPSGFYSSLFIATLPGENGYVTIGDDSDGTRPFIDHDYARIVPVRGERVSLYPGEPFVFPLPHPRTIYAFGFIEHAATGTLTPIYHLRHAAP